MAEGKHLSSHLEEALSDALAAKIAGTRLHVGGVLVTARLPSRDMDGLIASIAQWNPESLIGILSALIESPSILKLTYEKIGHRLLLWIMEEVLLPKIEVGEGIGRAIPTCRYVLNHLKKDDLDYGKWKELAKSLNETITVMKHSKSRYVVNIFCRIVSLKADRKPISGYLTDTIRMVYYWIDRPALIRISEKLCELIRTTE